MDQVTQQNAALVEEAAAAAESLQDQATNLMQVVSVFKLTDTGAAPITAQTDADDTQYAQTNVARLSRKKIPASRTPLDAVRFQKMVTGGQGLAKKLERY
jgi:hypothetical protein